MNLPIDWSTILLVHDTVLSFVSVFLFVFGLLFLGRQYILFRTRTWAKSTVTTFDDFVVEVMSVWDFKIIAIFSIFVAIRVAVIDPAILQAAHQLMFLTLIVYVTLSLQKVLTVWLVSSFQEQANLDDEFDPTVVVFIQRIIQVILWTLVALVLLQNYGLNVTAIVGGLGIGGIAVAFAVQNILGDLFSSVSLYFDKPFKVGDYIEVGEDGGTVKKIGLKTTRLETVLGEQLIISNKDLTEQRIHNYQRLERRRVIFILPLDVRTSHEQREKLAQQMPQRLQSIPKATFLGIYFKNITGTAYEYEVVYFVESRDYDVYLETHHRVNDAATKLITDLGIQLPYGKLENVILRP